MTTTVTRGRYDIPFISPLDILKPEEWSILADRYGDQFKSAYLFFRAMGSEYPTARDTYNHTEVDRYYQNIKVLANVAGTGAGNPLLFTLSPDSLDANNNFFVDTKKHILFKGGVVGRVTNINTSVPSAPVITVVPVMATEAIPALTAGEELILFTNAHGQGTGQPVGTRSTVSKFTNYTQIIKGTFSADGSSQTEQTWLTLNGVENAAFTILGQEVAEHSMAIAIDGALMFGKPNTNNLNDEGNRLTMTKGFIPSIIERGNLAPVPVGTVNISDYNRFGRIFQRENCPDVICQLMGYDRWTATSTMLFNYFRNTNMEAATSAALSKMYPGMDGNSAKGLQGLLDFEVIKIGGYTYVMKVMKSWSDPTTYGSAGYTYKDAAVFWPMGKVNTDPETKRNFETIATRYKELNGINRRYKLWNVGGAVGNLNDIDIDNTYIRAEIGGMYMGLNQTIWSDVV